MHLGHRILLALWVSGVVLGLLISLSFYNARRTLSRELPGLVQAPVQGRGRLARGANSGSGLGWLFNFYERFDRPSSGGYCESAQVWVSLTGKILETFPPAPGLTEWISCVRGDTSQGAAPNQRLKLTARVD